VAGEIDLDLEFMFIAAKKYIPDKADRLADVAQKLYHVLQGLNEQAALAGDPAVLTNLLKVGGETYDALGVGVTSLNNAALAVNATAQDFVKNDDDARADLRKIDVTLDGVGLADAPVPSSAPEPPVLDDPSTPGAPRPDDEPSGGHPSQGGTTTTPDPVAPGEDAEERGDQQEQSEQDNPYQPEEV
jgi:hypothetical protein